MRALRAVFGITLVVGRGGDEKVVAESTYRSVADGPPGDFFFRDRRDVFWRRAGPGRLRIPRGHVAVASCRCSGQMKQRRDNAPLILCALTANPRFMLDPGFGNR